MGWVIGVEPTASRATIWRSNQLSYTHHVNTQRSGKTPIVLNTIGAQRSGSDGERKKESADMQFSQLFRKLRKRNGADFF